MSPYTVISFDNIKPAVLYSKTIGSGRKLNMYTNPDPIIYKSQKTLSALKTSRPLDPDPGWEKIQSRDPYF
jgi:hypothetical protein